jgi:hypothetical protein
MKVRWTKTDDKGPSFNIKNVGPTTIVNRKIAGTSTTRPASNSTCPTRAATPKPKKFHTCSGNFFQGVMKPAESAVLTFSCVTKKDIPDGSATIAAEMQMVGFADAKEKKIDF